MSERHESESLTEFVLRWLEAREHEAMIEQDGWESDAEMARRMR